MSDWNKVIQSQEFSDLSLPEAPAPETVTMPKADLVAIHAVLGRCVPAVEKLHSLAVSQRAKRVVWPLIADAKAAKVKLEGYLDGDAS